MRFPALAATLKSIAKEGRDGFYAGEVAEDMVAELKALGGLHTLEDFAAQAVASYVEPISAPYRGVELVELPPSNHGIVALIMLKMLERLGKPPAEPVSVERYHVLMEAARLAYAMRDDFVADPDMADVPVEHMLDDAVIDKLVARIDRKRHRPELGAAAAAGRLRHGVLLHRRREGHGGLVHQLAVRRFRLRHRHGQDRHQLPQPRRGLRARSQSIPTASRPRKRPMHTLVPAMVLKDGKPLMAFGVMGAHFQPMGHVYIMSNMFDYGMDAQEALDAPRMFFEGDAAAGGGNGAGRRWSPG